MKKRILPAFALSLLGYLNSNAQVAVGTFTPDSSAQLEVSATNKGVLLPRIALSSTTVTAPIVGTPAQSLFIYNTSTAGDVTPGYYYWENATWKRVLNPSDIAELETLTTFALNGDGHNLNYTDENGAVSSIDLATVIDNFETVTALAYDGTANTLTYKDENNTDHLIDIATLVKNNETLTSISLNADGRNLDYTAENGLTTQVDLSTVIANLETVTNLTYDATLNTLTYNDEDGTANAIDIDTLVKKNETVTDLTDNLDGTFTYTNESGTQATYDVSAQIEGKSWLLKGNAGTDALTDFIGTTDAKPLVIKTNAIERIVVKATGNVGINVAEPTSSVSVSGSESHSIKVITESYTATDKDYTIVSKSSVASTLELPQPSTCTGRIYYIVNNGTVDLSLTPAIEMASGVNTNKLGTGSGVNGNVVFGNRIKVQSDGTAYIIIQ